jgi:hypothetical protein
MPRRGPGSGILARSLDPRPRGLESLGRQLPAIGAPAARYVVKSVEHRTVCQQIVQLAQGTGGVWQCRSNPLCLWVLTTITGAFALFVLAAFRGHIGAPETSSSQHQHVDQMTESEKQRTSKERLCGELMTCEHANRTPHPNGKAIHDALPRGR